MFLTDVSTSHLNYLRHFCFSRAFRALLQPEARHARHSSTPLWKDQPAWARQPLRDEEEQEREVGMGVT